MRKLLSATVSAALCVSAVAPGAALAQDYRFTGFDAPRGATATLNLRVPLGSERQQPSAGLTFGHGQTLPVADMGGQTRSRQINLADFRFTRDGLRNARVASFDLANLDRDRRMNLVGASQTMLILIGVAVVVGGCLLLECHDEIFGDDNEDVD